MRMFENLFNRICGAIDIDFDWFFLRNFSRIFSSKLPN